MPSPIRYHVHIEEPHRHEVRIEATLPVRGAGPTDLHLPTWTPGSYLIREFARHVSELRVRDRRGRLVPARKVAKSTWRVDAASGPLRVSYRVYAHERSVRTSHVTSDHAFLSPPTLLLYADGLRERPCEVAVSAPRGWRVACALPERRGRWLARNYDQLVDSPIECGHHREAALECSGTPFRLVVCGAGDLDLPRLRRDVGRIAAAQRAIFGRFPFPSYLAILHLTPAGRGGLEHRTSAAIEWPRHRLREPEAYTDFLALFSHELFHAWNVKEAAPGPFRPYDYLRETPTRLLWWFEGVTDYFAELVLRRAGLLTVRQVLDRLVGRWERLQATPGRLVTSVADASFDAWIKLYRPDENTANSTVSYYEKGHLVGALLDLEVRRRSAGSKSLDDVARLVVERGRRGLAEDGVQHALEAATGSDFRAWLGRHVDGTAELPFERALASVGLALERTGPAPPDAAWLGLTLKEGAGAAAIASIRAGGPAESAGLSAFDQLVALDGLRVDERSLAERLRGLRPGASVRLSYFRDDELGETTVRLGAAPARYRAVTTARPGLAVRARAESWLGAPWQEISRSLEAAGPPLPAAPVKGSRPGARRRPPPRR